MTHLKIVLFILIAFLIENQLFASGNEACLEKLLEEGTNSSLNLECSEELLSDESDDDENVFDEDVLPDYFAQRRLFQSHWGFVQTDCNQVPEDWENGFYQNKNKIIYHIASQGEEIQKRPFSEIPVEDMFVIADLIENKVVFYQWFNNLMQEKMKDMSYLSEKFLNKKMPTSWKKHFYLGGLIKYYIYNHHLLDLLAKNAKDSFTEITRPLYREEKGFVKLIDHPTTALSDIRNILRKIELNLKEDVDLQKCYLKKHDHKPCSKKCLHHYFSKIKNGDLYYYYNLSFGRFCLLQEIFGVDFIKNLTDQIVLWTSQKPEETKQVEVDELIKSIKSDKVKTPKKPKPKKIKKKKGMFSQVASKIGKGVKIAENVVKIVQNPQEEVEKLTQRMNALLFQQSKLKRINVEMRKRLEYETAKLQQAEVEKDEIRDQYTLLKSELAGFEAQREAEMQKLYYLEQATNQAFAHVHSLQQIAGNSRSEAESLRAYTEGLSAQTESLLAYNQYLAYLLQQRDAVIVMQHHFIQQSQAERLALLSENARMSAAIEQFKKEKKDSISD